MQQQHSTRRCSPCCVFKDDERRTLSLSLVPPPLSSLFETAFLQQQQQEDMAEQQHSLLESSCNLDKRIHLVSFKWYEEEQQAFLNDDVDQNYNDHRHHHQQQPQHQPHLSFSTTDTRSSIRNVWKWKDAVLGDGRDFFVPKPRILTALQAWMLQQINYNNNNDHQQQKQQQNVVALVDECAILSNCARLEVLFILSPTTTIATSNSTTSAVDHVIAQISACFQAQAESYRRRRQSSWLDAPFLISTLDWPGVIDSSINITNYWKSTSPSPTTSSGDCALLQDMTTTWLSQEDHVRCWTHIHGVSSVARHLSLVAAGMAPRPSRPNRPVPFRPFSARDAHIMLQLKRTLDIFGKESTTSSSSTSSTSSSTSSQRHHPTQPHVRLLLETALRAGKGARTMACVPQLQLLLQYGTGNSKYEVEPPTDVTDKVAQAARIHAIEPMVKECVAKCKAIQASAAIASLRQAANALLLQQQQPKDQSDQYLHDERRWLHQMLHQPTMQLRNGGHVDIPKLIADLEIQLEMRRTKI